MGSQEEEAKKNIGKRLKRSNRTLWQTLSSETQASVVEEYYHLFDVEKIGIRASIQDTADLRRNFGFLVIGLLAGIIGNMFVSAVQDYLPNGPVYAVTMSVAFIGFIFWLVSYFEKLSAERFNQDKVLENLIIEVQKKERK